MAHRSSVRIVLAALLLATLTVVSASAQSTATYTERYRPQYHFTPAVNWMNDPNGLVYYDGEYHLFYQYNPFGITWGHMSWGHAVSRDLVHWTHLPVALGEENDVMIFSGSAVVDWNNTSGFGSATNPPLIAVYTGHHTEAPLQDQRIAYSLDHGRTWTKYAGNPVVDIGRANFRDPKVFWYAPENKWVMAVALPTERKVRFYASKNLKDWTHLSDFGPAGATKGIWECPDLFRLPVKGAAGRAKWVLIVSINGGEATGGSRTQYFIGTFDGTTFTNTFDGSTARWVDYGKDFYAAQSWSGIPEADGRRIWLGWMNNWLYGEALPTHPWRGAQSLPRSVHLRSYGDSLGLVQHPVDELQQLRYAHHHVEDVALSNGVLSLSDRGISGKALEIVAEFEVGTADEIGLKVRVGEGQETVIGYDTATGEVFVDRMQSGADDFHPAFAGRHGAPVPEEDGHVKLHVFVDWSSVEVFAEDGAAVITDRIFPDPTSDGVALYAKGGTGRLVSLDAWKLHSVWPEDETRAASKTQE